MRHYAVLLHCHVRILLYGSFTTMNIPVVCIPSSLCTQTVSQVVEVCGEVFCDSSPLPTALGGSFVVTEKYLQVWSV